jgi:hypothetical protein
MASFKWPPDNRRYAREQADSDRHLEKHHQRSGFNSRRFPMKQICGLAADRDFRLVDGTAANFFIRRFNVSTDHAAIARARARLPVVTARIDRFIAEDAKAFTQIWSKRVSGG